MNRALAVTLAVLGGGLAGGVSYALGSTDPGLTGAVGVCYAVVVWLSLRHPDTVVAEDVTWWTVGPWSGASIALLLAVALVGVGWSLPLAGELRFSLRLLVVGAGYAMWLLGISYARAKAEARERTSGEDGP